MPKKTSGSAMKTRSSTVASKQRGTSPSKGKARSTQGANQGRLYSGWDLPTAAERVSKGLPTGSLNTVQKRLKLSNQELAEVVQISSRTLTRRKKEKTLPPDESERVYRINRLVEIATDILGGQEEARQWMKEANFALGDEVPLSLARTEPGAQLVERVLHQIEHGIIP